MYKYMDMLHKNIEFQRTHTLCALSMHVYTEEASVLHVQQYCTAIAGILHCTCLSLVSRKLGLKFCCIHVAAVAEELKHLLKHTTR